MCLFSILKTDKKCVVADNRLCVWLHLLHAFLFCKAYIVHFKLTHQIVVFNLLFYPLYSASRFSGWCYFLQPCMTVMLLSSFSMWPCLTLCLVTLALSPPVEHVRPPSCPSLTQVCTCLTTHTWTHKYDLVSLWETSNINY